MKDKKRQKEQDFLAKAAVPAPVTKSSRSTKSANTTLNQSSPAWSSANQSASTNTTTSMSSLSDSSAVSPHATIVSPELMGRVKQSPQ
jgi:hypothetical protein